MLARFYHGGVVLEELTPQQWRGLIDRIADLMEFETGQVDHASRVERRRWRELTGE